MIGVSVLGSTGSVGVNTLDVLDRHRERYRVVALSADRNVELLYRQCLAWRPDCAVMQNADAAEQLQQRLPDLEVLAGPAGLQTIATLPQCDAVMAAIVGAAGLRPTLAAARAGKRVMLANKEALVMAGALFSEAVRNSGAELIPVDSEHSALFQCMPPGFAVGQRPAGVSRLLLTASGGPFLDTPHKQLFSVTPEQACEHPNWTMGRKISVDSATLMNKGLEVIEAHCLFGLEPSCIEVLVHPQSVIHSLVEYRDGSVLAQLGKPDMRTPIACALSWPERLAAGVERLDLLSVARLDFAAPDVGRFPCLRLAYEALAAGGGAPTVLNAANEIAVHAFLEGRIRFTDIATLVEDTLARVVTRAPDTLAAVLESDADARRYTQCWLREHAYRLET